MNSARSVPLLVAILLVGLAVSPVASGTFASAGVDDASNEQREADVERGVTAFMQSSAADTATTVESEMFEARYEAADDETRERLVDERVDELAARYETLERERELLRDRGDELSTPQYQARMTRLTVEIAALERSIAQTKPVAADNEVGVDRLESLESDVAALGGEQIAAVATEVVGFERFLEAGDEEGTADRNESGTETPPVGEADAE